MMLLRLSLVSMILLAAPLPPALEKDRQEIEARLNDLERRLEKLPPAEAQQSIEEARQWIDEFTLDAELLDDDPVVKALNGRLEDLVAKSREVADQMKKKMEDKKPAPSASREFESLLKIDVDLKNVSFKRDVAPIVAEACLRCHNPRQMNGEFDASTFASFAEHIEPGNADDSHLIKLVTGRSQPRMPRGGGDFSPQAVEIWSEWIRQGAKFDGPDEESPITDYLVDADAKRRERIEALPSAELDRLQALAAARHLEIVRTNRPVYEFTSERILVRTTLPESDAEYIAVLAEAILEEVLPSYRIETLSPFWMGRLGLFVFADRVDYISMARLVDNYIPEEFESGHVRFRPELSYAAMAAASRDSLDLIVAQQMLTALFNRLEQGKMPPWAIYGSARAGAVAWDPAGSTSVREEVQTAASLVASGRTLVALFGDGLPWKEQAPMSTALMSYVAATDKSKLIQLQKSLAATGDAAGSIQKVLRKSPDELTALWSEWLAKRSKR